MFRGLSTDNGFLIGSGRSFQARPPLLVLQQSQENRLQKVDRWRGSYIFILVNVQQD